MSRKSVLLVASCSSIVTWTQSHCQDRSVSESDTDFEAGFVRDKGRTNGGSTRQASNFIGRGRGTGPSEGVS